MVRIFPDRIQIRSDLEEFYLSVSDSEDPISVTDSYQNAQKLHFYDVDIHYNLIWQKLTLSVSGFVFEQKYKNKYNIINIRPYSICLHHYEQIFASSPFEKTFSLVPGLCCSCILFGLCRSFIWLGQRQAD